MVKIVWNRNPPTIRFAVYVYAKSFHSLSYFKRRSFWFSFHRTNYKTDFLAKSLTKTDVFFVLRNLSATQTSNSQIVQIHIPQTDYPSL